MEEKNWYKVILETTNKESELIELVSNLFFELGSIGVEVNYAQGYLENDENLFGEIFDEEMLKVLDRDTEIIAYFNEPMELSELEFSVKKLFNQIPFKLTQNKQLNENWQKNWMQHYHPQPISRYLTIVPVWQEDYQAQPKEQIVYLDPGVAFGTGNHPTTQLGAQALEIVMRGGETILDVGTGSGILTFIAKALGAQTVYGYDLDPQAVASANENLNYQPDKEGIQFAVNNLLVGVDTKADIIIANILPHIIIEMLDDAERLLKEKGWLILGGILISKSQDLEKELRRRGWKLYQKTVMGEWVSLILKKQEQE
ncbi:hypothetical protein HMPREF2811_10305 [Globicatella sp. HMSC072A10]|uniref:50S ribosomal protein L11 methyltransferase n=1 Tax=Globicatella sp. HMSC072A10 TaxID=1739315 RepID=UPI0008C82321|nr:50S ribosomal protein L11 methyltransferase [Globicatella sp. HMSC072A10]OFK62443.1 hypothetical protein HMPREF2811_10305 [Globicatella sp. HMSC072A10]